MCNPCPRSKVLPMSPVAPHPAVQAPRPPRAADFAARCCGGRGAALSTAASGSVALWATQWAGALGRRDGAAPWPRRERNNREPLTWTDFYHPAPLGRADAEGAGGEDDVEQYPPEVFLFPLQRKTEPPRGVNPTAAGPGTPGPDDEKHGWRGFDDLPRRWDPNQWPAA